VRVTPSIFMVLAAACHGAAPKPTADELARETRMDSATARRICQSPDSVIAGTKECVLLDQGIRHPPRTQPAPRSP
jgi:hypothetical protein